MRKLRKKILLSSYIKELATIFSIIRCMDRYKNYHNIFSSKIDRFVGENNLNVAIDALIKHFHGKSESLLKLALDTKRRLKDLDQKKISNLITDEQYSVERTKISLTILTLNSKVKNNEIYQINKKAKNKIKISYLLSFIALLIILLSVIKVNRKVVEEIQIMPWKQYVEFNNLDSLTNNFGTEKIKSNPLIGVMKIGKRDIIGINLANEVSVKIDQYPFIKYGVLNGQIRSINYIIDLEDKYTIIIMFQDRLISSRGEFLNYITGMSGTGEINTGKISLFNKLVYAN